MTLDHKPSSSWNSLPEAARSGGESQDKRQGKGRVGGGGGGGGEEYLQLLSWIRHQLHELLLLV